MIWRSQAMKFSETASGVRSRASIGITPSDESASQTRCGNITMTATTAAIHGSVERRAIRARAFPTVNSTSRPTRIRPT